MGCTVSGVERKHFEGFVLSQESAVTISITNNREYFPTCGKDYRKTALKDRKRSTNLDKIELLRTAESTRTFITKKIKKSPKMTTLSNAISNEINARVTSNTGQNKELFEGVDRICEANKTGQTVQAITGSYACNDHCVKVPWRQKSGEKQKGEISEAGLGYKLKQDNGSRKACFKFYISTSNWNNNSTNYNLTTPSVLAFYSCTQNDLLVDKVKCSQVAVAVHERFFNAFGDDCDDDEFVCSNHIGLLDCS